MTREQFAMELERVEGQVAALEATSGTEIAPLTVGGKPIALKDAIADTGADIDALLERFLSAPDLHQGQGLALVGLRQRLARLEVARYPIPKTPEAEIEAVKALQAKPVTVERGPDGR